MPTPFILPLDSPLASLELVGGKGANLSRLIRAGFPIPSGLLITTRAYRAFGAANELDSWIIERMAAEPRRDPGALQALSESIRGRFSPGRMPGDLRAALLEAHQPYASRPVAVRSSATAEDLPGLSFAGQQETFLNVLGQEPFLNAVVECWSSLWTAQAIGYRSRNRIPDEGLALAVVVQEMVPSEASGVLFTANPVTGRRGEAVIDATLGLGEALVGGEVDPDHYVVNPDQGKIVAKILGAKELRVRGRAEGGVERLQGPAGEQQALPDSEILALAEMGRQVESEMGFPQDIEWAWAGGSLFLLQSRPITSLYPLPESVRARPGKVFFSFGAIQGIQEPLTPLGRDAIRLLFVGAARLFGHRTTHTELKILRIAGERLWGDMTPVVRTRIVRRILPYLEPGVAATLERLDDDPALSATDDRLGVNVVPRILRVALWMAGRGLRFWLDPDGERSRSQARADRYLKAFQEDSQIEGDLAERPRSAVKLFRELVNGFPQALPTFAPGILVGILAYNLLNKIQESARADSGPGSLLMEIARGLPHNVTTEMDLRLWEIAQVIAMDPDSASRVQEATTGELAAAFHSGSLPGPAQAAVTAFLEQYGMRGVAEIDIGRPRWREAPEHIFHLLQSYLKLQDPNLAPDLVFARGSRASEETIARLVQAASQARMGWIRAPLARGLARRFRALAGLRESPKFHIIQLMGIVRKGLLDCGSRLVAEGRLARPDDLFFLTLDELEAFAEEPEKDWAAVITGHREAFEREALRRQVPRVLLSDGRAFYEGLAGETDESELVGSPVSPGITEGTVRVVLDPRGAEVAPGEILVCPGTDPAWTPLFLTAGGLIMEMGGMMTHGSVVAREYGIPAVVGVHQATLRLVTGQRVRLDGSAGRIQLLDD